MRNGGQSCSMVKSFNGVLLLSACPLKQTGQLFALGADPEVNQDASLNQPTSVTAIRRLEELTKIVETFPIGRSETGVARDKKMKRISNNALQNPFLHRDGKQHAHSWGRNRNS